jgi:uncharacterized iron-regulated membrane protein
LTPFTSTETAPETSDARVDATAQPLPATAVHPAPGAAAEPSQTSLYRVVWRWHFYAGLLVAPFLFLVSATGALYVFHNEIADWRDPGLRFVQPPADVRLSYDEQLRRLKGQVPDFTELDAINLRNAPDRTTEFIVHALPGGHKNPNQMHRIYYVNPYTGALLGSRVMEQEFFHRVLDLHRSLCAGMTGRLCVELATSWGIVLLLTGVYLWWPRSRGQAGVWWPRLRAKRYLVLRDLHSVFGMNFAVFSGIVLATGLFVSVVWGTGFTWVSQRMEQSLFEFFAHAQSPPTGEITSDPAYDPVVQTALAHSNPGDNLYFQLAEQPEQAHKVYVIHDSDTNTVRGLDIDQYTGRLVSSTPTEKLEPMVRLLALMVSLHQGKTFGLPSKIAALATCLVLMALSVTGVWMWCERRPRGKSGFPSRPVRNGLPAWLWAIIAITGILLPTVGVSVIVFMLADAGVRRLRWA